jgi:hypothetical protein
MNNKSSTNSVKWIYVERWNRFVIYFLPIVIVFFTWVIVGNIIELNYRKENLNNITGQIINIKEIQTRNSRKNQDFELRLYLDNYKKYFRITDNFKYQKIEKKLKIGDEIKIYFRPKYYVLFGFGKQTDVYELQHKNETLFNISERKRNSKGSIKISLIVVLIFGSVYYFARRKIKNKKNY